MAKGSSKGSSFERQLCKDLSLWWTDGERDDVFWRTPGSGARAKTRSKTGQETHGCHGDVGAVDPIGEPLIQFTVIEAKRGYRDTTITDMLDMTDKSAQQQMDRWIQKAIDDRGNAGSWFWMLVTRRNRREALVTIPFRMVRRLFSVRVDLRKASPSASMRLVFHDGMDRRLFVTTLSQFMLYVKRSHIEAWLEQQDDA